MKKVFLLVELIEQLQQSEDTNNKFLDHLASYGVGEACLKYLKRQNCWQQLMKNVEKRNERVGSYSFRHSYSVRGHLLDIDNGSMSLAMGHSIETPCREYPWATKSATTNAFEIALAA